MLGGANIFLPPSFRRHVSSTFLVQMCHRSSQRTESSSSTPIVYNPLASSRRWRGSRWSHPMQTTKFDLRRKDTANGRDPMVPTLSPGASEPSTEPCWGHTAFTPKSPIGSAAPIDASRSQSSLFNFILPGKTGSPEPVRQRLGSTSPPPTRS